MTQEKENTKLSASAKRFLAVVCFFALSVELALVRFPTHKVAQLSVRPGSAVQAKESDPCPEYINMTE